ncbi:hypothetical protein [Streptomyces sp. NPDC012888]|uniref:hypothetical protein n=1 Tax=Streptomyces sp. NPDC012888 TaxID=3364855 RepID=UPI0036986D3B
MSKQPRAVTGGVDTSGPVPVEYRFSHAKNGNRHLVVVFANLHAPEEWGWQTGILDPLRSNILWIRDKFDGANSYYLCKGMDFSLEQAVAGVIHRVMNSLGLTPDQVTMFGSSKGGTAALFYGLRYGFRNIVCSVPQFRIGTFVQRAMPAAARMMMGQVTEANVRVLDSVMPDIVRSAANRSAHIYLLTSPRDEQYGEQLEPFLPLFQGYENFNFVYNESPLISGHAKVTLRNAPMMLGLLNLLVEGVAPRLGSVRTVPEAPEHDTSGIDAYLRQTGGTGAAGPARAARPAAGAQTAGAPAAGDGPPPAPPTVTAPAPEALVPATGMRVTGFAPGAVRVSFWERGKYLGSPRVAADGSWAWEPDRPWTPGRHVVKYLAVDAANRFSERSELAFTVVEQGAHQQQAAQAPAAQQYAAAPAGQQYAAAPAGQQYRSEPAPRLQHVPAGPQLHHVPPGHQPPQPPGHHVQPGAGYPAAAEPGAHPQVPTRW